MGAAIKKLGLRRSSYLVSSKFYFGIQSGINERATLNRKYLLQAVDGSLERFRLDYLDLVYCHRADKDTPIEETVWAMHDVIQRGKALYWGTSEWSADEIRAAYEIAVGDMLALTDQEHAPWHLVPADNKRFARLEVLRSASRQIEAVLEK